MPNGLGMLIVSAAMQVGVVSPPETPNFPPLQNAYQHYGFEGQYEQRYQFDSQQNWVHGYFQEIPAYGGHAYFRPYNYKDILSQSQVSAGWGHSPVMPYSQQFWHKYHDQATMLKLSRTEGGMPQAPAVPVTHSHHNYGWQRPSRPAQAVFSSPLPLIPPAPAAELPEPSAGPILQPAGQQMIDPATFGPR